MHALVLALILAATTNNPTGEFANLPYGATKDQVKKVSPNVHQGETPDLLIDTKDTAFGQPVESIRFMFQEGGLKLVLVEYAVDNKEKTETDKIAEAVIRNLANTYGKGKILIANDKKIITLWVAPKGMVLIEVGTVEGHNYMNVMYVEAEFFKQHPFTPTEPSNDPEYQNEPKPGKDET